MRLAQVRRAALALPEVVELETWGEPTFRLGAKILCIAGDASATIKATREQQAELIAADPAVFSCARYVGRHGWVSVQLAKADPREVAELLEEAWRLTAPKRLLRLRD